MRNKIEFIATLKNMTPELFELWKSREHEINQIAESEGTLINNVKYCDKTYTKSCDLYYDSELEYFKAILAVDQAMSQVGLNVKPISRKLVECDCHALINEYRNNFPRRREYA